MKNHIHTNLIITFILIDILWINNFAPNSCFFYEYSNVRCTLFVLLNYFLTTSYFLYVKITKLIKKYLRIEFHQFERFSKTLLYRMFVEGLYLYMLVMKTFSVGKISLFFFNFVGWILPAILMMFIWAPLKYIYSESKDE